jgi:hypothetical protein
VLQAEHLQVTDGRRFSEPFTPARAMQLRDDPLLGERLDAFSARFARLQDTAGDMLLGTLLTCLGEPTGSVLDNLDTAARLGLLSATSDDWIAARTLRNRTVHECIRQPELLAHAVNEAHAAIRRRRPPRETFSVARAASAMAMRSCGVSLMTRRPSRSALSASRAIVRRLAQRGCCS